MAFDSIIHIFRAAKASHISQGKVYLSLLLMPKTEQFTAPSLIFVVKFERIPKKYMVV